MHSSIMAAQETAYMNQPNDQRLDTLYYHKRDSTMHQSTLKVQFRLRCIQCHAFSAQSYSPEHQSILCHRCNIYIGTPACKVCHGEDTQAHQPKNGRWVCNTCGGTFTFRSLPTKAEKRRLKTKTLPCKTIPKNDGDDMGGLAISICSKPDGLVCQSDTFFVCDRNNELQELIGKADHFTKNRNIAFDCEEFRRKVLQIVKSYESANSTSTKGLASAAEEALFACHIIELAQTMVKLSDISKDVNSVLAMIMNFSSVQNALNSGDEDFLRALQVHLALAQNDMEVSEDDQSDDVNIHNDREVQSEVNSESELVNNSNKNGLAGCHRTAVILEGDDGASQDPYDVDWRWFPGHPSTLLTCGFTVRLLN